MYDTRIIDIIWQMVVRDELIQGKVRMKDYFPWSQRLSDDVNELESDN